MSTRRITKQQFSDGTTIDGNRIETALQDIENIADLVPSGLIGNRFTQTQIVAGFQPILGPGATWQQPWMSFLNAGGTNIYRVKGTGYNLSAPHNVDDWLLWEVSIQRDHPIVIMGFDVFMAQDTSAIQAYYMQGASSPPYIPPNVQDIQVFVVVDNPFIPEDRDQATVVAHYSDFDSEAWLFSPNPSAVLAPDMLPAHPGGGMSGWQVNLGEMSVPVAPYSRVRLVVALPYYSSPGPGQNNWGVESWRAFAPSMTATILEPNTNG